MIEEFFAQDGPRKLMFFYQETTSRETLYSRTDTSSIATQPAQKKLFLTTGNFHIFLCIGCTCMWMAPSNNGYEINDKEPVHGAPHW